MDTAVFMQFFHILEKLKCNTRHCDTSTGRRESVAEHSFRTAAMAYLLSFSCEGLDMNRVIRLCLVHDFGEAVTGDIPCFAKTGENEKNEENAWKTMTSALPEPVKCDLLALFSEFSEQKTPEAKMARALDKLEAVIQHNESDLSSWLSLEYTLNRTYGTEECRAFPVLAELRERAARETDEKIEKRV